MKSAGVNHVLHFLSVIIEIPETVVKRITFLMGICFLERQFRTHKQPRTTAADAQFSCISQFYGLVINYGLIICELVTCCGLVI